MLLDLYSLVYPSTSTAELAGVSAASAAETPTLLASASMSVDDACLSPTSAVLFASARLGALDAATGAEAGSLASIAWMDSIDVGTSGSTAALFAVAGLAVLDVGTCGESCALLCLASLSATSVGAGSEAAGLGLLVGLSATSVGACETSASLTCLAEIGGVDASTCASTATLFATVVQRGAVRTSLSIAPVRNVLALSTVQHTLASVSIEHDLAASVVTHDLLVEGVLMKISGIVVGYGESAVEVNDTFTRESGAAYNLDSCVVEVLCPLLVGGKKAATIVSASAGTVKVSFAAVDFVSSVGTDIAAGKAVTADAQWRITTALGTLLGVPAQMARFSFSVRPWVS